MPHVYSPATPMRRCFLISFLLYLIPPCLAPPLPSRPPPGPSAANGAAHLLRQEVRSQRESGDSQPAGRLPVRTFPQGNAGLKLILGERLRRARRRGQPVGRAAYVLPLLLAAGSGQSRRLSAGESEGSQLQVSLRDKWVRLSTSAGAPRSTGRTLVTPEKRHQTLSKPSLFAIMSSGTMKSSR